MPKRKRDCGREWGEWRTEVAVVAQVQVRLEFEEDRKSNTTAGGKSDYHSMLPY